jgi:protein-S-isoprenylcysteine O-methyltransferase Ste14
MTRKEKAKMKAKPILPTTYLLIALVIMILLHSIIPIIKLIPLPWNLLGLIPLIVGILINLMADSALHKAGTTVKPFQESSVLVTGSVYGVSRHPMYLGFVLILIGVAVLLGSLTPWVIIPIYVVLMEVVFIQVEEHMLEENFGPVWLDYKKKVRRWI